MIICDVIMFRRIFFIRIYDILENTDNDGRQFFKISQNYLISLCKYINHRPIVRLHYSVKDLPLLFYSNFTYTLHFYVFDYIFIINIVLTIKKKNPGYE